MTVPDHDYRGARALILLHEEHLRHFLSVWRRARDQEIDLPVTDDPDYASMAKLLRHVVGCARGYMVWMCKVLDLADPGIDAVPDADGIEADVERYLEHVLAAWRTPLRGIPEQRFEETFPSSWGTLYSVDAMLEHAVMHPIRHSFQLEELMSSATEETT